MATVYRRDFAPPAAIRRPSIAAAASNPYDHYVRARKAFEWSHERIFDDNNGRSIRDAHLPDVDEQSVDEAEADDGEFDEGVELDYADREERESPTGNHHEARSQMKLRQDEPDLPTPPVAGQVPHLELKGRLTPSPPPRRLPTADRFVTFVDDGAGGGTVVVEVKKLRSHWVQTPGKWRDAEHPLRVARRDLLKEPASHSKPRQKQIAPFLTNAHPSDRNAVIGAGHTFNVKSSGKLQEPAARRIKSNDGAGTLFTHVHRTKNHQDSIPSLIRQHSSRSSKQLLQTEYQRQFRKVARKDVDLEI